MQMIDSTALSSGATLMRNARVTFNPSRGGHAPGPVRGLFVDLVEAYALGNAMTPWEYGRLRELTGKLWNCTDAVPRHLYGDLEELQVSEADKTPKTYAQAARFMRWRLDRDRPRIRVQALSRPLAA